MRGGEKREVTWKEEVAKRHERERRRTVICIVGLCAITFEL